MKENSTLFFWLFIFLAVPYWAQAQTIREMNNDKWHYEIEGVGIGDDGTYMIRIWSFSNTPVLMDNQEKKNAVHGVIFCGFGDGDNGVTEKKPLAESPQVEEQFSDFFNHFFSNEGTYSQYIASIAEGTLKVIKINKKSYKIGVILSVEKDLLRDYLEDSNIIKGLESGF